MTNKSGVIFAVIGLIIFFFCVEAFGADWKFITIDSKGSVWEIDVTSISRQPNNIVRVWEKLTYSKEDVNNWVKDFGEKYKDLSLALSLAEYNCIERTTRSLAQVLYSSDGEVISKPKPSGEWSFIPPGSIAESLFEVVCKQPK